MASIEELFAAYYESHDRMHVRLVECLALLTKMEEFTVATMEETQDNVLDAPLSLDDVLDTPLQFDAEPHAQLQPVDLLNAQIHHDVMSPPTTTEEVLIVVSETQLHLIVADQSKLISVVERAGHVPVVVPFGAEHKLALVRKVFDGLPGSGNYILVEHKEEPTRCYYIWRTPRCWCVHEPSHVVTSACDSKGARRLLWPPPAVEQLGTSALVFVVDVGIAPEKLAVIKDVVSKVVLQPHVVDPDRNTHLGAGTFSIVSALHSEEAAHLVVHDHVSDVLSGVDVVSRGINIHVPANCSTQCPIRRVCITSVLQHLAIMDVDPNEEHMLGRLTARTIHLVILLGHRRGCGVWRTPWCGCISAHLHAMMCARGSTGAWRPPWPPPMVEQLGLTYYMGTIDVKTKLHTILRAGLRSFWFAAASVLPPFLVGTATSYLMLFTNDTFDWTRLAVATMLTHGGCDASVLFNAMGRNEAETNAAPNLTRRGFKFIDRVRRDLITCSASSGQCATFYSLVCGLPFVLEEMATGWWHALLWRTFFNSINVRGLLAKWALQGGRMFTSGELYVLDHLIIEPGLCLVGCCNELNVRCIDVTIAANPSGAYVIDHVFPHTYGRPLAHFVRQAAIVPDAKFIAEHPAVRVDIVFYERQSTRGHNVIWKLYNAIKAHNHNNKFIGFLGGSDGLFVQKTLEILVAAVVPSVMFISKAKLQDALSNLTLDMLASHVLGAFWYVMSNTTEDFIFNPGITVQGIARMFNTSNEMARTKHWPQLIVAEDLENEAWSTLTFNKFCVVRVPGLPTICSMKCARIIDVIGRLRMVAMTVSLCGSLLLKACCNSTHAAADLGSDEAKSFWISLLRQLEAHILANQRILSGLLMCIHVLSSIVLSSIGLGASRNLRGGECHDRAGSWAGSWARPEADQEVAPKTLHKEEHRQPRGGNRPEQNYRLLPLALAFSSESLSPVVLLLLPLYF